jgi:hypothetical protein
MLSLYLGPKVITLTGFHCTYLSAPNKKEIQETASSGLTVV